MRTPILGANNYTSANNLWGHSTETDVPNVDQSHHIENPQGKNAESCVVILENCPSKIDFKIFSLKENISLINYVG